MNLFLAAFYLLGLVQLSLSTSAAEGKSLIQRSRQKAESELKASLSKADGSVLTSPLEELSRLEKAALEDVDDIAVISQGDSSHAIDSSVSFWTDKMNAVIQPYIQNPKAYDGVVIRPDVFENPHNTTEAYQKTEAEIDNAVSTASREVEERYREELQKLRPSSLEDVTKMNWIKYNVKMAYEAAVEELQRNGHYSKVFADRGDIERSLGYLHPHIQATKSNFETNLNDIKSQ